MTEATTNGMTLWCAGLPFTGERPLSDREQSELLALQARLTRLSRFVGLCALPTFGVVALLAQSLHIRPVLLALDTDISRPPGILTTLTAALVIVELWLSYRFNRHATALKKDIACGTALTYCGVLSERSRMEPTQQRLLASGMLTTDPDLTQSIELLTESHILWRVNGAPIKHTVKPALTEVAPLPQYASIAAQWLEPVSRHKQAILYGGRRELSEEEKKELKRFVRRLVVRPATSSLPVSCLSLALATEMYRDHPIDTDTVFWIFVIGGVFNIALYLFQISQAKRFMSDLQVGYVGIRRVETLGADAHTEPDIEFLPTTGMLWTRSGEPAAWRRGST